MQEDDIVPLGVFCESVLGESAFTTIVQQYEMQCYINWKNTAPQNVKEREHAFAKLSGLQDFLLHMRAFVEQKNAILKENEPSSDDEDAFRIDY